LQEEQDEEEDYDEEEDQEHDQDQYDTTHLSEECWFDHENRQRASPKHCPNAHGIDQKELDTRL
jgi:hypothetical protein